MKAQNSQKIPSELCFGIMNVTNVVTKDSYLLNSKVAF